MIELIELFVKNVHLKIAFENFNLRIELLCQSCMYYTLIDDPKCLFCIYLPYLCFSLPFFSIFFYVFDKFLK